jgi:chromosome segregation ATPase
VLLLGSLAVLQWLDNRAEHDRLVEEHRLRLARETELDDLRKRATGLEGDVQRLTAGLTDAQKAADENSTGRQQAETEKKAVTAERDQLKEQHTKWETAIKDRDAKLEELSKQLRETRARLDEAVKRLEKK